MRHGEQDPSPPLPNGWLPTVLGATASLVVLVCVVLLTGQFLGSRPLDLRDATLAAAATIETGLLSNRVPEANIRAIEEFRTTHSATFHYLEYDVTVPSLIDPARLQNVLRRQLHKHGVSANATQGGRGEPMLELALAGQRFGYVRLTPQRENAWDQWPYLEPEPAAYEDQPDYPVRDGDPVEVIIVEEPRALDVAAPASLPMDPSVADALETVYSNEDLETLEATTQRDWVPPVHTAGLPPDLPARTNKPGRMRVAIIVDDGGYGGPVTERVLALDPGLTLSILPYTPFAEETARRAQELGFEVMLHMPMENYDPELRHEGQLEVGMSPAAIGALTLRALDHVPGAVGVNNHMGSKFTADRLSMRLFIEAIEDTPLYFVDSRTTADSRAYDVAFEAGLPSAYRHIFLDHENDTPSIERQFQRMMQMAEENGSVIAIAHFRSNTVDVLERMLPSLEDSGMELVPVSELLR